VAGRLLLVLYQELLDVLAALEELVPVLHLEGAHRPVVPPLAPDHRHRPQRLRVDVDLVLDGLTPELPAALGGGKGGEDHVVVQEDVGEQLVLVEQSHHVQQVLAGESLAEGRQAAPHLLHLRLVSSSVDGDELAAHLHLPELGSEVRAVHEEAALVESLQEGLQRLLLVGVGALELIEEVEEGSSAQVVPLEAAVHWVSQSIDDLEHVVNVEEVEAEGVLVSGLVEVAAAHAVPDGDVGADLRGEELGEAAHAGHGLSAGEAVQQVLGEVGLDGLQVLDLVLADEDPDDCEVHVEVAHHLAARHQLGEGVVAHRYVRAVRSQRDGAQQPVLREGVLPHLVGVLHAGEGRQAGLELGLEVRVIEDPERAGVDVVDDALLDVEEEGLALVDEDLRHVLVHDDGALDGILGEILELDCLVQLALDRLDGRGHLVGLDLANAVLSPQVAAQADQVVDLLLELASAALLEVVLGHVGDHLQSGVDPLLLEHLPDLLAVVHLLPQLLGELLDEAGLHGHQLVLELGVALPAHVDADDQLLDAAVLGLEVLQTDLLERVQHLVVLLRVLHHRLQRVGASLAEHLALRPAGKRAGHGQVGLVVAADHKADCPLDLELVGRESVAESEVAGVDAVVSHLAVSDQDDAGELMCDYFLSDILRTGAARASHAEDAILELLLGRGVASRVPEIVMGDVLTILCDDICNGLPVVLAVTDRARVINEKRE
jgi:hypothetical protein